MGTNLVPAATPADDAAAAFAPRRRADGSLQLEPPPRGLGPPGRFVDGVAVLTDDAGRWLVYARAVVDASWLPERWELHAVLDALAVLASRQGTTLEVAAAKRLLGVLSGVAHPLVVASRCNALEELGVVVALNRETRRGMQPVRWLLRGSAPVPVPAVPAVDPLWTDRGLGALAREVCRRVDGSLPTAARLAQALALSEEEVTEELSRLRKTKLVRSLGPEAALRWRRVEGPESEAARRTAESAWAGVVVRTTRRRQRFRTSTPTAG